MSLNDPAGLPSGAAQPGRHPGPVIRMTADYGWRILIIGAVGYFAIHLLEHLSLIVIPFIAAMLATALLHPILKLFKRLGVSRGLATVLTLLTAVGIVGGLIAVVVIRAADQAPQLGDEINRLIPQVKNWLITGPLKLNPTTVNNLSTDVTNDVSKNSSKIASTALSTGKTVLQAIAGMALAVFSTIFLLYDGDRVWGFLIKGVPLAARDAVDASARAAWTTVSHYVRGTLIVALFHGIVVGVALAILGVPLAFPLAVLVGLGAFVPLVGAFVAGALAVGVAGLSQGLFSAIVVVAILVADNQIEAHALQPFVVGRYVRIHPLAVVLALGTGAILFGIVGAIVAVPTTACINSAVRAALAVRSQPPKDQTSDGDIIPTGGG